MKKRGKQVTFGAKPSATPAPAVTADAWVAHRSPTASGPSEPTKRLTLDLPASLHRRIKAQCARDGVAIVAVLRALLEKRFPE